MLKYFYITNNPEVALIAQDCGVDRIFIDMEYIGKEKRQPNLDTVKNHHTVSDVENIRRVLTDSELLVRVNPVNDGSYEEINSVIEAGADVIMLPMFKTADEVKRFIDIVNKRAKTLLLLETDEAVKNLDSIIETDGINEIHIGLNDLYLSQDKTFMFELLCDGTVDGIAKKIKAKGIPFGIGGVGAVKSNVTLPAENILCEHYRLGSTMVILARAFCDTLKISDLTEIKEIFEKGIKDNREYETMLSTKSPEFFSVKHEETKRIIDEIIERKKEN